MAQFTDLTDFILDQVWGYQDANEVKNNTLNLRNAFIVEHGWSADESGTTFGVHADNFITSDMIKAGVVGGSKMKYALTDHEIALPADSATDQTETYTVDDPDNQRHGYAVKLYSSNSNVSISNFPCCLILR